MSVPIANIMEPADWQDREMERLEAENAKLVMKLNAEHLARQNVERENDRLRDELDFCLKYAPKCDECAAMLDCDECLRADSSQKERKRLDYENAKLREEVRHLKKGDVLHVLTDQELAEQQKHEREMQASINALDDENVKLRELVNVFYHCTTSGECDECPINGGGPVHLMPDTICDTIHDRMREAGVDA